MNTNTDSSIVSNGAIGILWDIAGKLAIQLIRIVITIILARILSPRDFGIVAMSSVVIGIGLGFLDFGLGYALIYKNKLTEDDKATVFIANIVVGAVLFLCVFAGAEAIGEIYNKSTVANVVRLTSVIFIIGSFGNVRQAMLARELNFKLLAQADIVSSIISGIVAILCAFMGLGLWSLAIQVLVGSLVKNLVIWWKYSWKITGTFRIASLKELSEFSNSIFASSIINSVYERLDVAIIGRLFSENILGLFYRAVSFNQLITKFSSDSLVRVLFPVFSRLNEIESKQSRSALLVNAVSLVAFVSFAGSVFVFLAADGVIGILFGRKWMECVPYVRILILSAYVYPVGSVLMTVITGSGKSRQFFKLELVKKIVVSIAIPAGFAIGIKGYLWAMFIANAIMTIANVIVASKTADMDSNVIYKSVFMNGAVAGAVISCAWYLTNGVSFNILGSIGCGAIALLVYVFLSIVLRNRGLYLITMLVRSRMHNIDLIMLHNYSAGANKE